MNTLLLHGVRLGIVMSSLWPGLASAQDIDRGRALAERWCGNCHLVDRSVTSGRADGLPSLPAIASNPATNAARLRGFMSSAHGRMPDFSLGAREQDDLAAYILSLRGR